MLSKPSLFFVSLFSLVTLSLVSCFSLFGENKSSHIKSSANAGKTKKAELLKNHGNATVGFSWGVSIVDFGSSDSVAGKKEVFVVDRNHSATGFKDESVAFRWITDDSLEIRYDSLLRVFRQDKFSNGVTIIYKPSRVWD